MTDAELLTAIETTINEILVSGQFYSIGDYMMRRPELKYLLDERDKLLAITGRTTGLSYQALAIIGEVTTSPTSRQDTDVF